MIVFHGTSKRRWHKPMRASYRLYVTTDLDDAIQYAYEAAARDEEEGRSPEPIVYRIDTRFLSGLKFEPDESTEFSANLTNVTWEDTVRVSGSFVVVGYIEKYKKMFRVKKTTPQLLNCEE